jgi:hypothetical protein
MAAEEVLTWFLVRTELGDSGLGERIPGGGISLGNAFGLSMYREWEIALLLR